MQWISGTPRGALGLSPITGGHPCDVSPTWATASAPGLVVRAADNAVALDLDGDGRESNRLGAAVLPPGGRWDDLALGLGVGGRPARPPIVPGVAGAIDSVGRFATLKVERHVNRAERRAVVLAADSNSQEGATSAPATTMARSCAGTR